MFYNGVKFGGAVMDKEKLFAFIVALGVVFMLASSGLAVFGSINENTAVKISCILIGGVLSVLAVFFVVLAVNIRD